MNFKLAKPGVVLVDHPLSNTDFSSKLWTRNYFFIKTNELGYQKLLEMVEGYECQEEFLVVPGPLGLEYFIISEKSKFVSWCMEIFDSSFRYTMRYVGLEDKYPNFMYDVIFNPDNPYRKGLDEYTENYMQKHFAGRENEFAEHLDDIQYEILTEEDIATKYPYLKVYTTLCCLDITDTRQVEEHLGADFDNGEMEIFQRNYLDYYNNNYYLLPGFVPDILYNHVLKLTDTEKMDCVRSWINLVDQHFAHTQNMRKIGYETRDDIAVLNRAYKCRSVMNVQLMIKFVEYYFSNTSGSQAIFMVLAHDMLEILKNLQHIKEVETLLKNYDFYIEQLNKHYQTYMKAYDRIQAEYNI